MSRLRWVALGVARSGGAHASPDALARERRLTELKVDRLVEQAAAAVAASVQVSADAQRAAMKDYIPDLSKFDRGSLTSSDQKATLFQSLVGGRALEDAAAKVAKAVKAAMPNNAKVYVTTSHDFAARDALPASVIAQLSSVSGMIDDFS